MEGIPQNIIELLEKFQVLVNSEPIDVSRSEDDLYDYISISKIEEELSNIYYGLVQFEITNSFFINNTVIYNCRIRVYHPIIQEWLNYDGTAAVTLKTKITKEGTDEIIDGEVLMELAVPLAYAEAIKNASKKIGKKFGADLNRTRGGKVKGQRTTAYDVMPFDKDTITDEKSAKSAFTLGHITKQEFDEILSVLSMPAIDEVNKSKSKPKTKAK